MRLGVEDMRANLQNQGFFFAGRTQYLNEFFGCNNRAAGISASAEGAGIACIGAADGWASVLTQRTDRIANRMPRSCIDKSILS